MHETVDDFQLAAKLHLLLWVTPGAGAGAGPVEAGLPEPEVVARQRLS